MVAHNSGSAESVTDFKAWNNENLTKLLVQSGKLYDLGIPQLKTASIEAHDNINFSGTVRDSDNNPVPLTSLAVNIQATGSASEVTILLADENGYFNGSVPLKGNECSAIDLADSVHNRVHSGTLTNPSEWWDISYGVGRYDVFLPNGTNIGGNYFYHICEEKLVEMCYKERDYNTGNTKWTCI